VRGWGAEQERGEEGGHELGSAEQWNPFVMSVMVSRQDPGARAEVGRLNGEFRAPRSNASQQASASGA
jgi:hypothetical protein